MGATVIMMQRNLYKHQTIIKTNGKPIKIMPFDDHVWNPANPSQSHKVVFEGADYLNNWEAFSENVYRQSLLTAPNFYQVFVDQTLSPVSTSSRPAPNAVLWEANNFNIDYKMTPVLSLIECQSTPMSFY